MSRSRADDVIPTDELIRRHGAKPFQSIEDLPVSDPFGCDEEYEAFMTDLYAAPARGRVSLVVLDTDAAISSMESGSHPRGRQSPAEG